MEISEKMPKKNDLVELMILFYHQEITNEDFRNALPKYLDDGDPEVVTRLLAVLSETDEETFRDDVLTILLAQTEREQWGEKRKEH